MTEVQMPKYRSHKVVRALEIDHVEINHDVLTATIHFTGDKWPSVVVQAVIMNRYFPSKGDYYIVYPDGYKSISPKKAFEEGYTLVDEHYKG